MVNPNPSNPNPSAYNGPIHTDERIGGSPQQGMAGGFAVTHASEEAAPMSPVTDPTSLGAGMSDAAGQVASGGAPQSFALDGVARE